MVEDYVARFSELMDKIAAYEERPDSLHYTTRFLDGLKPVVRVLIAIQQPHNLEVAYTLALLYEELGDNSSSQHYQPYSDSSARSSISTLHYAPDDALFYSDQHLCQCSSHYATSAEYSRACPAVPR
jgi:hypothetical protein